jgi:protein-S-isoprenylcysteine O-methyltransferase Ste14
MRRLDRAIPLSAAPSDNVWMKAFDFAAAMPLIVWLAWNCGQLILALTLEAQFFLHLPQWALGLKIVNQSMAIAFFVVQIALFALRPVAKEKSRGILPRFAAIFTMCAGLLYFYAPVAGANDLVQGLAALFGITGLSLSIYALRWLGRSFSILPEARHLVTGGPYRYVRHPLYVAEALSTLGITLQLQQPLGILIALAIYLGQFARMGYEEEVLERSFPEYAEYRKRTFRLIPFVY